MSSKVETGVVDAHRFTVAHLPREELFTHPQWQSQQSDFHVFNAQPETRTGSVSQHLEKIANRPLQVAGVLERNMG